MSTLPQQQQGWRTGRWYLLLSAVILALGCLGSWFLMEGLDRERRHDLLQQAVLVAQAVPPESLRELTGTDADLGAARYLRLKNELALARSVYPACRFLYLMGRRPDGTVFFYVDSEPADSRDYSPPGQVYEEVSAACRRVFDTRVAMIEGPVTDRWGTWMSASVPIMDPATGMPAAVLGMDVDAHAWRSLLIRKSVAPLIFALGVVVVLLSAWRLRAPGEARAWRRHVDPVAVFITGAVLSSFAAWVVQRHEARTWEEAFVHLAASRTDAIRMTLEQVRDTELESLAQFCSANERLSSAKFQSFVRHLVRNRAVLAWEWVPAVPAAESADFVAEREGAGLRGAGIWQRDAEGKRVAAAGRDVFYPVALVAPVEGSERTVGYDVGSDPVRRRALEAALRTGMPTATALITLVQEAGKRGMFVASPVYRDEARSVLRGYAVAMLRMDDLLHVVASDKAAILEIAVLQSGAPPEVVARSLQGRLPGDRRLAVTRPVFAFGAVFAVTAHAGPHFASLHSHRAGWLTLLAGLVLAGVLAGITHMVLRGQERLQELVTERTVALSESEANFRAFFETLGDMLVVATAEGRILRSNRALQQKLGYGEDELLRMQVLDLHSEDVRAEAGAIFAAMLRGERDSCPLPLRTRGGALIPVETRVWRGRWNGADCIFGVCKDLSAEQEAQQRFERLFRNNPALMALSELPTRVFTDVNEAFVATLGYGRDEVVGRTATDLGLFVDPEEQRAWIDALQAKGRVSNQELHVRHKDGAILDGLFSGEVISSQGRQYFLTVMIDISERKRMESALNAERIRLDGIIRGTNVGTWEWNVQTGAVVFNERWADILGYTLAELAPVSIETWMRLAHPEDLKVSGALLDRHFKGELDYYECECRMRHKDGRWVWVLDRGCVSERMADGRPLLMAGTHQDVDARKALEHQLRAHGAIEALMAAISTRFINLPAAGVDDAIQQSMGEIGKLMGVDRVYVFRYTPDLSTCSNTHEWCSEGTVPQRANLQDVPSSALPWWSAQMKNFESIVIPDVRRMPPEAAAEQELLQGQSIQSLLVVPMVWVGGLEGFIGFDSVARLHAWDRDDVSPLELLASVVINALKRKQSEESLQATQQSLRELNATLERRVEERTRELQEVQSRLFLQDKMASIGQLAAGLAHEINNPVGFVATNFATLEENMRLFRELLESYRAVVEEAGAAVPAMAARIAELRSKEQAMALDFMLRDMPSLFEESRDGFRRVTSIINSVRTFARKDDVGEFVPYNLNKGIEDTLVITRNAYKYSAEVRLELGELPDVPCVPGQVNQVLLNLVVNAAQAVGGASVRDGARGRITIRTWDEPDHVACEVADNGPGIPPGLERQIFDPFFTTKPPGEGTGLGLSISYGIIVGNHGGTIAAANGLDGGACFRITLPHRRAAAVELADGIGGVE